MKKLFLSLMLVAGLAAGFTSCNKQNNESTDHTQTFTLGETSYDIDHAISILNIKAEGQIYNAIVLSEGRLIGETGGEGEGVVILFKGNITAGSFNLSDADNVYPKYFVAKISIDNIVDFDFEDLQDNEDTYMAKSGVLTIDDANGKYVITSDGIEVNQYDVDDDNNVIVVATETSSVDFEGTTQDFTLATVLEGQLNHGNETEEIVTAGTTSITLMFVDFNVACFITEDGNFIGFESTNSFANGLPEGEFTNSDYPLIMVQAMDIQTVKTASAGTINIAKEGEYYTIDITATIEGVDYQMHYRGTMPYFEIPM